MVRPVHERFLVIGDVRRELHGVISQALPGAQVTSVASIFDGIAELASTPYSAVLAAAEPMERRPEAAVETLRSLAGEGRLILFGNPTFELLSRKMLDFGCDDYIITPATPGELQQMFAVPALRLADLNGNGPATHELRPQTNGDGRAQGNTPADAADPAQEPETPASLLLEHFTKIPLADIVLDALVQSPHDAPSAAVKLINAHLPEALDLRYLVEPSDGPESSLAVTVLTHPLRGEDVASAALYLSVPAAEHEPSARHVLAQVAHTIVRVSQLQDRHNRLQKLAITDELTGLYNGRYFRHFLAKIMEKARAMRFPVTLMLCDIDDFKKYNDQFGHGVGDEILKQTATLMRRCCREHDVVARIGGDEFAVVFWEKEGPRQPRDSKPGSAAAPSRPPQTPLQIFDRFKRLMESEEFSGLGQTGQGVLGISAGLSVYPYDAQTVADLIKAADEDLMFRAKQGGKGSILLVGGDGEETPPPT